MHVIEIGRKTRLLGRQKKKNSRDRGVVKGKIQASKERKACVATEKTCCYGGEPVPVFKSRRIHPGVFGHVRVAEDCEHAALSHTQPGLQ